MALFLCCLSLYISNTDSVVYKDACCMKDNTHNAVNILAFAGCIIPMVQFICCLLCLHSGKIIATQCSLFFAFCTCRIHTQYQQCSLYFNFCSVHNTKGAVSFCLLYLKDRQDLPTVQLIFWLLQDARMRVMEDRGRGDLLQR